MVTSDVTKNNALRVTWSFAFIPLLWRKLVFTFFLNPQIPACPIYYILIIVLKNLVSCNPWCDPKLCTLNHLKFCLYSAIMKETQSIFFLFLQFPQCPIHPICYILTIVHCNKECSMWLPLMWLKIIHFESLEVFLI